MVDVERREWGRERAFWGWWVHESVSGGVGECPTRGGVGLVDLVRRELGKEMAFGSRCVYES